MNTSGLTPDLINSAIFTAITHSEPYMPTAADDAAILALYDRAYDEAKHTDLADLERLIAWTWRQRKASKDTSLSRPQINLSGVLAKAAGDDVARKLFTARFADPRYQHIALFATKLEADYYMRDLAAEIAGRARCTSRCCAASAYVDRFDGGTYCSICDSEITHDDTDAIHAAERAAGA
jgi:hypothetical protein